MKAAVLYAFSLLEIGVLGIRTSIKRCEQLIQSFCAVSKANILDFMLFHV